MNHLRRVDRPPAIAMWDFSWLDRCRPSAACQDRDLVEFIAKCAARDLRLGPSTWFQNDTTQYCVMPGYATIREATLHYIKKPGSKARPSAAALPPGHDGGICRATSRRAASASIAARGHESDAASS